MYLTLLLGMMVQRKTNQSQFQFSSVQRPHLISIREVSAFNSLSPKLAKSVQHQHYFHLTVSIHNQEERLKELTKNDHQKKNALTTQLQGCALTKIEGSPAL